MSKNKSGEWIVWTGSRSRSFRSAVKAYEYLIRQQDRHGPAVVQVTRDGWRAEQELREAVDSEEEDKEGER